MDIRQLRYLVSLARERHFARAAHACGIAQPTLSAALRQLEEEFAVPIVERGNRFQGFTPEGERFLVWARQILADCEGLEAELASLAQRLTGRLRLGVIPTALGEVARLTRAFREAHPVAGVTVQSLSSIEIQRGLDRFELHAGVSYLDNEPLANVRETPLLDERYVLVARADSDLAGRAEIRWSEVASLPLALLTSEMQNRRIVDAAFRAAGAQPKPFVETNSFVALLTHVRDADLVAVAPASLVAHLGAGLGVRGIPLVDPCVGHIVGLVILDREPVTPIAGALWRVARAIGPSDRPIRKSHLPGPLTIA